MRLSHLFIWILSAFVLLGSTQASSPVIAVAQKTKKGSETKPIQVGVLATRGSVQAHQRWQDTMGWLNTQIPNVTFDLVPLDLNQMRDSVELHNMEFVITNPGQAVMLGREFPLSWLATVRSPWPNGTQHALGSALVVRSQSDFRTLSDLQGSEAIAVAPNAFGGFLTLAQELNLKGFNPESFFSQIDYVGFPLDVLLYQLRDKQTDVAIVPTCLLEDMSREGLIDSRQFRVLNPQSFIDYPCQISTQLYPNWSFAKTNKADEVLATKVTKALLSLPTNATTYGWASPLSPYKIDQLLQNLGMHPQQIPWWQEGLIWLKKNQQWGWMLLVLILILNSYHFWVEYKFNRSQNQLKQTMHDLKQKSQMLEHAQRIAIVGELGSSIAHEVNQPLTAIRNYTQGMKMLIKRGADSDDLAPVVEKMDQQVVRVSAVIKRMHALSKKRQTTLTSTDLFALTKDSVTLLEDELIRSAITIQVTHAGLSCPITVDSVGIQQVLINLLTNAMDACKQAQNQQVTGASADSVNRGSAIDIHLDYQPDSVTITVRDNGIGLSDSNASLQTAFVTTKPHGLGLGLAICRDIVENHHGELNLKSAEPNGCVATVLIPYHK